MVISSSQIDLTPEERITLDGVCKLIRFSEWSIPTNQLFFTMAKEATANTFLKPLAIFGKTQSGEYTEYTTSERTQYTLCTYPEYGFHKDNYYVADTLEPLLQVALSDMKVQPKIDWAEIK